MKTNWILQEKAVQIKIQQEEDKAGLLGVEVRSIPLGNLGAKRKQKGERKEKEEREEEKFVSKDVDRLLKGNKKPTLTMNRGE